MTVTALSIGFNSLAFHLALKTNLQSVSSHSNTTTQYRSASNSLLARAVDKTPRRDSHSKGDLNVDQYSIQARSLYSLPDKPGRHKELSITVKRISSPNRDIEKRIAFSGIFDLSPSRQYGRQVCRQGQRSRLGCCQSFHTYFCKILFPTIRLTLL
ncbi:hypothetical protein AVEN_175676-1 [Araneus ventricosus]|uniref:Uncharacterized protein n=1 Tax=Araneus ventricosus TaxID=182803 RepID=A0A4Y2VWE3_ARAVE|nr:hypothetical protein AVEN_175676-1 [Araneus ventricosus]